MVYHFEGSSLKRTGVTHSDVPHGIHAGFLVVAIIMTVGAETLIGAAIIISKALAIEFEAFCSTTPATVNFGLMLILIFVVIFILAFAACRLLLLV